MIVKCMNVIALLAFVAIIDCGKCPAGEHNHLIEPCVCDEGANEIICNTNENFNLRQVFDYMTQTIDWRVRHFKRLIINAPEVTQLEETTFYEITFDEIFIVNAQKLQRIHSNAFGKTRLSLKTLYIDGADQLNSSSPDYNLFDALSSLNNIHVLEVNGANVKELPDFAFRPLLGNQWNLTNITLIGNVEKVGNFAFYDPSYWVRKITLGNKINLIATHAFDIRFNSHQRLIIDLSNNLLTANSFEAGVFLNSKRALYLNLTNNKLTHFDEFIFEPFLDLNVMNQIDIRDNLLVCDCRMKWLLKNKVSYEKQVVNAVCADGRSLWSYTMDEINECKITDVIV